MALFFNGDVAEADESLLLVGEIRRDVNDISGENSSVIGGVPSKITVRETDARPRYGVASVCGIEEEKWRIRFRFILLLFGNKRSFLERDGTISEFTMVTAVLMLLRDVSRGSTS
ncbi:unnamed protein product [Brassica oleracea]